MNTPSPTTAPTQAWWRKRSHIALIVLAALVVAALVFATIVFIGTQQNASSTSASQGATETASQSPSAPATDAATTPSSNAATPKPAETGVSAKQIADKAAAQAKAAAEKKHVDDTLTQLGYGADKGWTSTMTAANWAKVAANNPGYMVQGTSFAKTPQEAAAAAVNNPAVAGTLAQKADPNNWKLVYNDQCMTYPSMAYQAPDGNIYWGSDFVECGVAIWVNTASGGSFRLLCDNATKAAPVATQLPPSLPTVTPNPVVVPPVVFCKANIPVGDARCKPPVITETMQVCIRNSGNQTLVTIEKKDYNPATQSTNVADCVKLSVCVKADHPQPGSDWTWDASKCKWTPPVCVKPAQPGEGWTWDQAHCKWCPPAPPVCVKADHPQPGSDWTWDETHCKWTPPFVCPESTFPNPSNPKDCLDSKDPSLSPPPADGHTPALPPVGKTPLPTPTSNQIDPTTPIAAPAPPVTQAPDTTPTPTTPVPPVEAPAPTGPTTPIADPDQPTVAASVAVPAVQQSVPVAAPAPVAKAAPVVVQATATVAAAPAPATTTAPAVHAAAPAGATSAPVAAAPAATSVTTVAAAPAAHVGG